MNCPSYTAALMSSGLHVVSQNQKSCPRCKEKKNTERQTMNVVQQLEGQRIKREYIKQPIKIGNSLGITFPKEVAEVFGISAKGKVKIYPHLDKMSIEIIT